MKMVLYVLLSIANVAIGGDDHPCISAFLKADKLTSSQKEEVVTVFRDIEFKEGREELRNRVREAHLDSANAKTLIDLLKSCRKELDAGRSTHFLQNVPKAEYYVQSLISILEAKYAFLSGLQKHSGLEKDAPTRRHEKINSDVTVLPKKGILETH